MVTRICARRRCERALAWVRSTTKACPSSVIRRLRNSCSSVSSVSHTSINIPLKIKENLSDQLENEPRWADGDVCSECSSKFSLTMRKHHCRHCGRLLCARCSERTMPILKYDLQKAVRVCDICYDVLTLGAQH